MFWVLLICYGVWVGMLEVKVREGLLIDENGYFIFVCMNCYFKVSVVVLDLWVDIL